MDRGPERWALRYRGEQRQRSTNGWLQWDRTIIPFSKKTNQYPPEKKKGKNQEGREKVGWEERQGESWPPSLWKQSLRQRFIGEKIFGCVSSESRNEGWGRNGKAISFPAPYLPFISHWLPLAAGYLIPLGRLLGCGKRKEERKEEKEG